MTLTPPLPAVPTPTRLDRHRTVYVAGPMRHYPAFNFPAFFSLTTYLRAHGWTVFNPAEHDVEVYPDIEEWEGFAEGDTSRCPQFSMPASMRWDLARITECDAVVFLPHWDVSAGALMERSVAKACDLDLLYAYRDGESWLVSDTCVDEVLVND